MIPVNSAADVGRSEGLNVQVSGSAAQEAEMPGGVTELIGIAVAAVVLAITFGSLVAAGLTHFSQRSSVSRSAASESQSPPDSWI